MMTRAGLSIIEPETRFAKRLSTFLAEQGYAVEYHEEAQPLLNRLPFDPPKMVLIGDGVREGGALALLRRIRAVSRVPCVVLASSADEVSHIVTLDAGADDFISRTLPQRALLARLRAVLRRAEWGTAEQPDGKPVGGWRLMLRSRRLLRPNGSECALTTAEFDLMRLLVEASGTPVSRQVIAEMVFRRPYRVEDRTVDNLVLRLRRKLGDGEENAIKTVRGAGYMFAGFSEARLRVA